MKITLLPVAFVAILASIIIGCTTAPSTTTVSAKVTQICNQVPSDVQLVLVPVLQKNPSYAPLVLIVGNTLPGLLQNGSIDAAGVAAALQKIPGLTAAQRQDLVYIQVGLPAALQLYEAISGKTVALYTDPNVSAIVSAFCQGLVSAAKTVPQS